MPTIAVVLMAALAAIVHVYIFVLESWRWEAPATREVFGTSAEEAATTRQLAWNQGFYNLFLGIGAGLGAALLPGDGTRTVGATLVVFCCAAMVGAAAVLVLDDRTKVRPAGVQAFFPALALLFAASGLLS